MKITEEVYALDATKGTNAFVILGQPVILIDSGRPGQGKKILKELASLNVQPGDIKHILLTHYDVDHIGNAAYLERESGAMLWASAEDIPCIMGEKPRHGHKRWISVIMPAEKPAHIRPYPSDGELEAITILPAPGHTPGHVCLLYQDVLFAGDLVVTMNGRLNLSPAFMNWDMDVLKESARKIGEIPFRWICPAHGSPLERGDRWKRLSFS